MVQMQISVIAVLLILIEIQRISVFVMRDGLEILVTRTRVHVISSVKVVRDPLTRIAINASKKQHSMEIMCACVMNIGKVQTVLYTQDHAIKNAPAVLVHLYPIALSARPMLISMKQAHVLVNYIGKD